jgi:hypothetical protein
LALKNRPGSQVLRRRNITVLVFTRGSIRRLF